jgi:hypothetical protein
MGVVMDAFGVPATVTTPGGAPVETTVAWVPPLTEEFPPASALQRKEPVKVLALRRDAVDAAPRGTLIAAPEELGGTVVTWRVDSPQQVESDCLRVVVVRNA